MTTQLIVYNLALAALGERKAVATSDATEPVRILDNIWTNGIREYCLEQGHWKFALKDEELTPSVTEIPTFGYTNAFAVPANFVRLSAMSSDEYFNSVVTQVQQKGQYWYSDLDLLYVRYVSKATTLGYDVTNWPETFSKFVALQMAYDAAERVNPDRKLKVEIELREAKKNALAKDAVEGPTQFLPMGTWLANRGSRNRGRNSRNSLYGS